MKLSSIVAFSVSSLFFGSAAAGDDLAKLQIGVLKRVSDCTVKAKPGDSVAVHYAGKLQSDGTEFDNSFKRGKPITFVLGAGQVIEGWDQGVLGMCLGEKRRLTIPPHLGYGERGAGPIPAQSVLVFDTELVGVNGVTAEEIAEAQGDETKEEL